MLGSAAAGCGLLRGVRRAQELGAGRQLLQLLQLLMGVGQVLLLARQSLVVRVLVRTDHKHFVVFVLGQLLLELELLLMLVELE